MYDLMEKESSQNPKSDQNLIKNDSNISIFCPLCKGYLISSTTIKCGHVFCSFCSEEYFLFSSKCPICSMPVRESQKYQNILLDKLVTQYLKKYRQQEYNEYLKTQKLQKQYKKRPGTMKVASGDIIDVRDSRHIWHKARVMRTFWKNMSGRVAFIKVRHMDSSIEEELPQQSHKIAPAGFFTNRDHIPQNYSGLTMIRNKSQHYLLE